MVIDVKLPVLGENENNYGDVLCDSDIDCVKYKVRSAIFRFDDLELLVTKILDDQPIEGYKIDWGQIKKNQLCNRTLIQKKE